MIKQYIEALMAYARTEPTDYGESVLTMLYECYSDSNWMANEQIRAGFRELYAMMNGMSIRAMDKIINPVCSLCRDHQRVAAGWLMGLAPIEETVRTLGIGFGFFDVSLVGEWMVCAIRKIGRILN